MRSVTIGEIESAINRWRQQNPPVNFANCKEVDQLATVYADMIFSKVNEKEVADEILVLIKV